MGKQRSRKRKAPPVLSNHDESSNKRFKQAITPPLLPLDVFSGVLKMSALKPMKNLVLACPRLLAMISREQLIRSAILQGGNPSRNVQILLRLLQKQQIHLPSTCRLLNIFTNARRCEGRRTCQNQTNGALHSEFGLFLCKTCRQEWTRSIYCYNATNDERHVDIFTERRLAKCYSKQRFGTWLVLQQPSVDTTTGEECGPVLTGKDIDAMRASKASVQEYTSQVLKVDTAVIESLVQAARVAKQDAIVRKQEKAEKMRQLYKAKMDRFSKLVTQMKEEMMDPRWQDFCLERHGDDNFRIGFVQDFMWELLRAPSKGRSKKKLRALADRINRAFEMLYEKGCHDFSFLSETNVVESCLRRALLKMFPLPSDVFRNRSFRLTGLNRVEWGDLLAVVKSAECPFLPENRIVQGRLRSALIDATIELAGGANDGRYSHESYSFASVLLTNNTPATNNSPTTLDFCKSLITMAASVYVRLRPVILCFLDHDATKEFLFARDGKQGAEADEWIAKKSRVSKDFIWRSVDAIAYLEQGQGGFGALRRKLQRLVRASM